MKINYTLDREDYKKAGIELMKKRYIILSTSYCLLSVIMSYAIMYNNFNWFDFTLLSVCFLFCLLMICIIPDLITHPKIKKLIDSSPELLGQKSLEIKPEGIEFNKFNNSVAKVYEWNTIKKTHETKNYSFITLKNNTSFILKNVDLKESDFFEKLKLKLKK